ncbi:hypothetical protein [Nevskia ramosa]|nr:hypothetical protein [Nevskia ramosa]
MLLPDQPFNAILIMAGIGENTYGSSQRRLTDSICIIEIRRSWR